MGSAVFRLVFPLEGHDFNNKGILKWVMLTVFDNGDIGWGSAGYRLHDVPVLMDLVSEDDQTWQLSSQTTMVH